MNNKVLMYVVIGGIVVSYLSMEQHHISSGESQTQHVEIVLSVSGSM